MEGEEEQNQTTTSTVPQLKNLIEKICQALDIKEETGQSLSQKEFDERVEGWAAEGKKMLLHNKELLDESDYKEFDDCFKNWEETNCFSRRIKARVLAASEEVRMAKSKSSENILNNKIYDVEKGNLRQSHRRELKLQAILHRLQNTDPRVRALEQNPSWISDEMEIEATNRLEKHLEEVGVIWDLCKEKWKNSYRLLVKFQQREGHANVPFSHREEGMNLGHWLDWQRQQKRKGELVISLEKRLEEVGVIWNVFREQWGNNYLLLVKYQQREGHANVPKKHKEEGVNLGFWLQEQRSRKKKRELDISLKKRLEDIGFIWDVLKEHWENNYSLLVKFQQREGHANVPSRHREEGVNLGKWLDGQRQQKRKGELDISLEERLEEVGVIWSFFKEHWGDNYLLLVKYQQREGHANVPKKHEEEGLNLGSWLDAQRTRKKKRKLDISREKLLDNIGTGTVWI